MSNKSFGELNVVQDREMEALAMLGVDFNYSATAVLRPTQDYALSKTGDAESRQIITELTYSLLNRDSAFRVHSISGSL